MSAIETQVGGDHYKKLGAYQPWEVLARCMTPDELRGFAKGTMIAYLMRERDKGGVADISKAIHTGQLFEELLPVCEAFHAKTDPSAEADSEGWITWNGGPTQLEGLLVDVKNRRGCIHLGEVSGAPGYAHKWDHTNHPGDIVAYRPARGDDGV